MKTPKLKNGISDTVLVRLKSGCYVLAWRMRGEGERYVKWAFLFGDECKIIRKTSVAKWWPLPE